MAFDVFISYSLKDADVARSICQRLESSGITCWIAPRNIEPGIPYAEAIIQGIEQSRSLLLVFSEAANNSPQVLREIERAVSKDKLLLTVRIEDRQPTASLEFFLSSHHWFDLFPGTDPKLLSALVQAVRRSLSRTSDTMFATAAEELPRSCAHGCPSPKQARVVLGSRSGISGHYSPCHIRGIKLESPAANCSGSSGDR